MKVVPRRLQPDADRRPPGEPHSTTRFGAVARDGQDQQIEAALDRCPPCQAGPLLRSVNRHQVGQGSG